MEGGGEGRKGGKGMRDVRREGLFSVPVHKTN